ncbi:hypothetical protein V5O48_003990 [Marasmius crinis-equi]|uniref:Uncharacterized protein n=1 Tax=Marasmius crinis-equi TaxID=585013 RepID=A0ABR3FRC1_9AGAR
MTLAASVVASIVPSTTQTVPKLSEADSLSSPDQELLTIRNRVLLASQPRRLDSSSFGSPSATATLSLSTSLPLPRHRRGLAWADPSSPPISPAVINSETALPLPDPPAHLYLDSAIQAALTACSTSHIKVDSPFNVSAFLNLLHRHPNRPLIDSVEKGFRFGFWPYDNGDWKIEPNRFTDNYTSDERDLSAIREYAANERDKAHWSPEILDILPRMVVSPMFVVWQGEGATKPRVVVDHTGSGLNDGISHDDV